MVDFTKHSRVWLNGGRGYLLTSSINYAVNKINKQNYQRDIGKESLQTFIEYQKINWRGIINENTNKSIAKIFTKPQRFGHS